MDRFYPKPNDLWRHADGTTWLIMKAVINDDRKLEVTIAAMDYSFRIEKVLMEDFMDEVDTDNYPDCKQKYMFEYIKTDSLIGGD